MLLQTLKAMFHRDLNKLKSEIALYRDESRIWYTEKEIPNSAGNLCLHLIGNLNAFIGAELGNTGYVRQRELEFSQKDVPRATLVNSILETISIVEKTLDHMSEEDLSKEYPRIVFNEKISTEYFLIHLATHLAYHLGQVNYHRRLLDTQLNH